MFCELLKIERIENFILPFRVISLTKLPRKIVQGGEPMQVKSVKSVICIRCIPSYKIALVIFLF